MPFPFNLIRVPFCVSGFTFSFTFPFRVSIVFSPPKSAVYKSIDVVVYKSLPDRLNRGWFAITNVIYKSPAGPPFAPGVPYPFNLITCPFSTPAGIVMRICLPFIVNICCFVIDISWRLSCNSAL